MEWGFIVDFSFSVSMVKLKLFWHMVICYWCRWYLFVSFSEKYRYNWHSRIWLPENDRYSSGNVLTCAVFFVLSFCFKYWLNKNICNWQVEVGRLKKELAEKESQLSVRITDKAADDELSWLNILSSETSENVQERINLQKALFELEETNIRNRTELQQLDDSIAKQQVILAC